MELTKERLVIVISSAVGITAVGLYLFLYQPLINKCRVIGADCKDIEARLLEARKAISSLRQDTAKRTLISEEGISLAIDELTKEGRSKGINFISITPERIEKSEDRHYKVLPIEMEIESTYKDLGIFLGSVDDLEKSLITVRSFSIAPYKEDPKRLRTKLVINMYLSAE